VLSFTPQRLLVLAPHTDDAEIGAGGLVGTLVAGGIQRRYVAFSTCEASVPAGFPPDVLAGECRQAARQLGFRDEEVSLRSFTVRRFPERRQDILEEMVALRREFDPDLVLCPSRFDVHQDHQVIHDEARRAFKDRTLLGYELPWNCIDFSTALLVTLSEDALRNKQAAFACYRSQAFRPYGDGSAIEQLARLRGGQAGARYAEAYEVIRWVWKTG
jgi:LmbE family N-acetylglucosaminyl deacetylase